VVFHAGIRDRVKRRDRAAGAEHPPLDENDGQLGPFGKEL
jgi:hypothetical protein